METQTIQPETSATGTEVAPAPSPAAPANGSNGNGNGTAPGERRRAAWLNKILKFRIFSGEQPRISPHAFVDKEAEIADDVQIGPFCVVGPHVKIGAGCKLLNNVTIVGRTTIGMKNVFFPNCVIGAQPQDLKYGGADTRLEIGDENTFREAVTIHTGTEAWGGVTKIGNKNLLMVNVHLAHDVVLGDRCIIANNTMIAGHVVIGTGVAMMGGVGIHHKVSIGDLAYLGGYAEVSHDVPPYVKVDGSDEIRAPNTTGLRRAGICAEDIAAIKDAVRLIWCGKKKNMSVAIAQFDLLNGSVNPRVKEMIEFLQRRDLGKNGRYLEGQKTGPLAQA